MDQQPPQPPLASTSAAGNNLAHHQHLHQLLRNFWANQFLEIERTIDFKSHNLPLARIKKIMKSDEEVRMIAAEAPAIFAKACEMFILEITMRSWNQTEESRRRTLQRNDVAAAIMRTDLFDFLVDIVPMEETKENKGLPAGDLKEAFSCCYELPESDQWFDSPVTTFLMDHTGQGFYAPQKPPADF